MCFAKKCLNFAITFLRQPLAGCFVGNSVESLDKNQYKTSKFIISASSNDCQSSTKKVFSGHLGMKLFSHLKPGKKHFF